MAVNTQQPGLFAAMFVTLGASTIALILRVVARRMTKVSFWWDDWFVLAAYLFSVGWTIILGLWARDGLGLYLKDISLPQEVALYNSRFYLYFDELAYAFSLAFSKLAILAFYWRMFRTSDIKVPIIALAIMSIIWLILRTFLAIFHCVPVQAFWDKSIPNATCLIDDSKFFFGSVLAHLCLDVAILSLPVLQVRKLQLRTAQKIGVSALFLFGTLVCVASVVVLAYSLQFDPSSAELPWNITPIMVWASVEVNLAVFSACLPMLRPILTRVLRFVSHNSSFNKSAGEARGGDSSVKMGTLRHHTTSTTAAASAAHNTRHHKKTAMDDSDSTHQLADSPRSNSLVGHSSGGDEDIFPGVETGSSPRANVVISSASGANNGRDRDGSLEREGELPVYNNYGILVKSETTVAVSRAV